MTYLIELEMLSDGYIYHLLVRLIRQWSHLYSLRLSIFRLRNECRWVQRWWWQTVLYPHRLRDCGETLCIILGPRRLLSFCGHLENTASASDMAYTCDFAVYPVDCDRDSNLEYFGLMRNKALCMRFWDETEWCLTNCPARRIMKQVCNVTC